MNETYRLEKWRLLENIPIVHVGIPISTLISKPSCGTSSTHCYLGRCRPKEGGAEWATQEGWGIKPKKKEEEGKTRLAWKGVPETGHQLQLHLTQPKAHLCFNILTEQHINVKIWSVETREMLPQPDTELYLYVYKQIQFTKNFIRNYASNAIKFGHWKKGIIFSFPFQEPHLELQ